MKNKFKELQKENESLKEILSAFYCGKISIEIKNYIQELGPRFGPAQEFFLTERPMCHFKSDIPVEIYGKFEEIMREKVYPQEEKKETKNKKFDFIENE